MTMINETLLIEIRQIIKEELFNLKMPVLDKELIGIKKASKLTDLAIATIYCKCSTKMIPYYKKGKFLYFKRSELIKWIEEGKQFCRK